MQTSFLYYLPSFYTFSYFQTDFLLILFSKREFVVVLFSYNKKTFPSLTLETERLLSAVPLYFKRSFLLHFTFYNGNARQSLITNHPLFSFRTSRRVQSLSYRFTPTNGSLNKASTSTTPLQRLSS